MELISIKFALFVLLALFIYYIVPKRHRWIVLLSASYAYYLIICNKYIIYMMITTLTTYIGGILIDNLCKKQKEVIKEHKLEWDKEQKKAYKKKNLDTRRFIMIAVLVINFGILGFLKYFNFLAGGVTGLLSVFGINVSTPELGLLLPLGISFYTFQTMGYIIDVYQEKVDAQRNLAKLALFVSFFPQIIQGPIAMYDDLACQLYEGHDFDYDRTKRGALLICWGIFKKLVIADRAVKLINVVTADTYSFSGTFILLAALMYSIQLYADFSGGIDIVRGIGEMFGIEMAENFRRPYFSKSLTEYWHRWHITLGNWVRNYVFYPLSISKSFLNMGKWMKNHMGKHIGKVVPTSLASLITFLIIGIWHGANGKYVAFGLWNGLVIMIAELIRPLNDKLVEKLHIKRESGGHKFVCMVWTFFLVLVGYYFDIASNFTSAMDMLYRSVFDFHISDFVNNVSVLSGSCLMKWDYITIAGGILVILIVSIIQERKKRAIRDMIMEKSIPVQWAYILAGVFAIILFGYYGPGLDPADFVYMQF